MSGTPVAAQVGSSKTSTVKVHKQGYGGYKGRPRPLTSDKDTPPIKDVFRDGKWVEGITEPQMIREGWRAPLQYQNGKWTKKYILEAEVVDPVTKKVITEERSTFKICEAGRFQKTPKEREELKKVHTNAKFQSCGSIPPPRAEIKSTLIIHRANLHHKKEFTTTISVPAYPSEVPGFIAQYHNPQKHKLIVKCYYMGSELSVNLR